MSEKSNIELITNLFTETDHHELIDIVSQIKEINNSILIYPLFNRWKQLKDSSISHYFISAIGEIDSNESLDVAKKMIKMNLKHSKTDLSYIFEIFIKFKHSDQNAINMAILTIEEYSLGKDFYGYQLRKPLNYLEFVNFINRVEDPLRKILQNNSLGNEVRSIALEYLMKHDQKKEVKYILDHYEVLKSKKFNLLLVKEIIKWPKELCFELRQIILKNNEDRALEIMYQHDKNNLVSKIKEIKNNIYLGLIHKGRIKYGFHIFKTSEELLKQNKLINSEGDFKLACTDIRHMLFQEIKEPIVISMSVEDIQKLFPERPKKEIEDKFKKMTFSKIDKLVIFLNQIGVNVDNNLYKIKDLNRIVGLTGHKEEKNKLIELLKKHQLNKLFDNKNWNLLHEGLLDLYKYSLEKILESIENINEEN